MEGNLYVGLVLIVAGAGYEIVDVAGDSDAFVVGKRCVEETLVD